MSTEFSTSSARGLFVKNARVIADLAFGGLFSKKKKKDDDDDDDRNFPNPPGVSVSLFAAHQLPFAC